jgi:hypothetical protein
MIRARCFALAVLVGASSWGASSVFAQPGMPGGYAGGPYHTPVAMTPPPDWYGESGEVVPAGAAYGPVQIAEGGFLRVEYLHWNLPNPGNVTLGAPLSGVEDLSDPFFVFTPGTNNIIAIATVPNTLGIQLSDVDGVRATVGLDLVSGGSLEIGAFMLGKKTSGFTRPVINEQVVVNPGDPLSAHLVPIVSATSLLDNGQIGNTLLLYNVSYSAAYASQLWGAEANYIGDEDREGLFWLNSVIGVRYFNLHEKLLQRGIFRETLLTIPDLVSNIDSVTYNNLYGPQLGARLEMVTKYIEMSLEPKLMFLGNTMFASVATSGLRTAADGIVSTQDQTTKFSFGVDVGTSAQINITPNFTVRVGYSFMWIDNVTRPEDNIYYNDNGFNNPPAVVTQMTRHDFVVHGASFGAELRY